MNVRRNEPVALASAVTTAALATVNVAALVLDWAAEVTAGVNLAVGGWIIVVGLIVRSRVTPVERNRG